MHVSNQRRHGIGRTEVRQASLGNGERISMAIHETNDGPESSGRGVRTGFSRKGALWSAVLAILAGGVLSMLWYFARQPYSVCTVAAYPCSADVKLPAAIVATVVVAVFLAVAVLLAYRGPASFRNRPLLVMSILTVVAAAVGAALNLDINVG